MICISEEDYKAPINVPGGYFSNNTKIIPLFKDYQINHEVHFLRYLYYLLIMKAKGDYPIDFPAENICGEIEDSIKCDSTKNGLKPIRKILIGEAPPVSVYYFYNPKGKSLGKGPWIHEVKKALFGTGPYPFTNKLEFLKACADAGFLLLDLFPYMIDYSKVGRNGNYKDACISAFIGNNHHPNNILGFLKKLTPFISPTLTFAFSLKMLGEIILNDHQCVNCFSIWTLNNNIQLNPKGLIDDLRSIPSKGISKFQRICFKGRGPHAGLLNQAGF